MSFGMWLLARKAHDNPRGDFIRDSMIDSGLPDMRTSGALVTYLKTRRGVCREAIEEGVKLFREYERWQRKQKKPLDSPSSRE